jgi:hypothetical protein
VLDLVFGVVAEVGGLAPACFWPATVLDPDVSDRAVSAL